MKAMQRSFGVPAPPFEVMKLVVLFNAIVFAVTFQRGARWKKSAVLTTVKVELRLVADRARASQFSRALVSVGDA